MSVLFIDFETTGLADFKKKARDPSQPHIVEAAVRLCDDNGQTVSEFCLIAKPDGWDIPMEMTAIHGVTQGSALKYGVPEKMIASLILGLLRDGHTFCAFNATFDKFILRIACRRFALIEDSDDAWWKEMPTVCTMWGMHRVMGFRPKLKDAFRHCFGKELEEAHGAKADMLACYEIFKWIDCHQTPKPVPA